MYYVMRASAPSLHRESTDSLIPPYTKFDITCWKMVSIYFIIIP